MLLRQSECIEALDWTSQDAGLVFVQEMEGYYHGKSSDLELPLSRIVHHWMKMKVNMKRIVNTHLSLKLISLRKEELTEDLSQL